MQQLHVFIAESNKEMKMLDDKRFNLTEKSINR